MNNTVKYKNLKKKYEKEAKGIYATFSDAKDFEENGYSIVKLHVDYIKHNTSVAFPTPIFVNQELNSIKYKIRSKHSAAEIDGEIIIKNICEVKH